MLHLKFSLALALAMLFSLAWSAALSGRDCNCWRTKESSSLVFTNYKMMDFRALASDVGAIPAVLEDHDANKKAPVTSNYFKSSAWISFFDFETWGFDDTPVQMINSRNNVYLQKDDDGSTYLTLRTHRSNNFQSAAEFDTNDQSITTVSMRVRARVHGNSGACAGLFTYKADNSGNVDEEDIEILTVDQSNTVHYSTHPEEEQHGNGGYSVPSTLPNNGQWTDWQEYRMDWTQPTTTFFVNGIQNGQLNHLVSQTPSYLCFNMWSSGNTHWEKTMDVGGTAYLDIQYIEVAYNTSAGGTSSCASTCTLE